MRSESTEWGPGPIPVVAMKPTAFRTYVLQAIGGPNSSVTIVGGDVMAQRVVLSNNTGGIAFVSAEAAELTGAGGLVPANAFPILVGVPVSFVVAPGQTVRAAGSAQGIRLSVSVSAVMPIPSDRSNPIYAPSAPSVFLNKNLPLVGVDAITLVRPSMRPQRVVVSKDARGFAYAASTESAGSLNSGAPAGPIPFAFEVPALQSFTFILAPSQGMVAANSIAAGTLSVSVTEVSLQHVLGSAGIPGPAGGNG